MGLVRNEGGRSRKVRGAKGRGSLRQKRKPSKASDAAELKEGPLDVAQIGNLAQSRDRLLLYT